MTHVSAHLKCWEVDKKKVLNIVEGKKKVRNFILEIHHLGNMNISCKCHESP